MTKLYWILGILVFIALMLWGLWTGVIGFPV